MVESRTTIQNSKMVHEIPEKNSMVQPVNNDMNNNRNTLSVSRLRIMIIFFHYNVILKIVENNEIWIKYKKKPNSPMQMEMVNINKQTFKDYSFH